MSQDDPRFSPVIALLAVSAMWEGQLSSILRDIGITTRKFGLLGHIYAEPGISFSELARRSHITVQSAHTAVRTLVDAAAEERVALMCGFVERFNPAILATHTLLDAEPYHLLAVRHSPHNPRTRSSVIDDLLIHDIDLVLGLARGAVTSIGGSRWVSDDGVEEVVDCTLHFDGGAVATLSSSRASQRKVRSISISTAEQLFEVDLLRHDLTTYRHRSAEVIDRGGPSYRAETVVEIPFVRHAGEPLALQFDHFVDLIEGAADPEMERATLLGPHEVVDTIKERVRSST